MFGLPPTERQWQFEHIDDNKSDEIIAALGVTLAFAIITVVLRFVSRHMTRATLGWDDWCILLGLLGAIGHMIGQLIAVAHGLGRHLIVVTEPIPFAKAVQAGVVFYITSLAMAKISILFLYRRIFPGRRFHVVLWSVGAFILAFTLTTIFLISFKCRPISGSWNPYIDAKCIDSDAGILTIAVMTIATDLVILGLPMPSVWKLQLPQAQKIQLTGVFLLGAFATGVSVYRATQVTGVSRLDISYDSINRSIWSGVEICVAIVCANLATLRPILNYLRTGKAVSVPNASTNNTAPSSGAWHGSGKSNPRRWTWRNVGASAGQPAKEGTFHRLEQQPGARSTDDVERQKFEGYLMSPVGSPRIPDNAHARDSDWPRSPMR